MHAKSWELTVNFADNMFPCFVERSCDLHSKLPPVFHAWEGALPAPSYTYLWVYYVNIPTCGSLSAIKQDANSTPSLSIGASIALAGCTFDAVSEHRCVHRTCRVRSSHFRGIGIRIGSSTS